VYSSLDTWAIKLNRIRQAGHMASVGQNRNVGSVLVGDREGKKQFGRPAHRWEHNIK
jgi:hypothetical protein